MLNNHETEADLLLARTVKQAGDAARANGFAVLGENEYRLGCALLREVERAGREVARLEGEKDALTVEREEMRLIVRAQLSDAISDVSEDYYAAGWSSGIEYGLWGAITGFDETSYLHRSMPSEERRRIKRLSELAGGWFGVDGSGDVRFMETCEWLPVFDKRVKANEKRPAAERLLKGETP